LAILIEEFVFKNYFFKYDFRRRILFFYRAVGQKRVMKNHLINFLHRFVRSKLVFSFLGINLILIWQLIQFEGITQAVPKDKSPSCRNKRIVSLKLIRLFFEKLTFLRLSGEKGGLFQVLTIFPYGYNMINLSRGYQEVSLTKFYRRGVLSYVTS
jgi:hypothetical protein